MRCLGCGKFIHRDDSYSCMECFVDPWHLGCLEYHYRRDHPRPQQANNDNEKTEEEDVLEKEAEDARAQWVDQMTSLSKMTVPLGRKIVSTAAAIVSVALVLEQVWLSDAADSPMSLLQ